MEYNKQQFQKTNDKKVLHKIKKHWVVVSMALLMAIGGEAAATHVSAHADTTNNNNQTNNTNTLKERLNSNLTQASNNAQSANQTKKVAVNSNQASKAISNQANVLHQRILQNASVSANKQSANQNASQQSNANNNVLGQRIAQNAGVKNAANNASQKQLSTARLTGTQSGQEAVPNNMPTVGESTYHGDSDSGGANYISEIRFNYVDQSDNNKLVTSDIIKGSSKAAFGSDGNSNASYRMRQWANEIPSGYTLKGINYDGNFTPVSQLSDLFQDPDDADVPAFPYNFPASTPTDHNPTDTVNFVLSKNGQSQPSTIWVYWLDKNNGDIEVNRQQVTAPANSPFTISQFMTNVPNNYVLYNSDVSSNSDYSDAKNTSDVYAKNVDGNGIPSDNNTNVPKTFNAGTTNVYIMVKSRVPKTATDRITYEDSSDNHAVVGHKTFTDVAGTAIPYAANFDKFVPSGFTFTGNGSHNENTLSGGYNNIIFVKEDKMSNIPANKVPKKPKDSNGSDAAAITVQYEDKDTHKIIDEFSVLGTPNSVFNSRDYTDSAANLNNHNFLRSVSDNGSIPYGYDFYSDASNGGISKNAGASFNSDTKFGKADSNSDYKILVSKDPNADAKSETMAHATIDYEDWITHKVIESDPISGLPNSNINYSDYTNYLPHDTQYYGPGPHNDLLENGDHDVIYVKDFSKPAKKAPINVEFVDVDNNDNDVTPYYSNSISNFTNSADTTGIDSIYTKILRGTHEGNDVNSSSSDVGNRYLSNTGKLGSDLSVLNEMPSDYTLADPDQPATYQFSSDPQFIVVPVKGTSVSNDNGTISDGNGNSTPFVPSPGQHHYGQQSDVKPSDYIKGLLQNYVTKENKKIDSENSGQPDKSKWIPHISLPSDAANANANIDTANHGKPANQQMPHVSIFNPSDNGALTNGELNPSDFEPTPGEGPVPFEYNGGTHNFQFGYQRKPSSVKINYVDEDNRNILTDNSVYASGYAGQQLKPFAYQDNIPMGYTYDASYNQYPDANGSDKGSTPYYVFKGQPNDDVVNIYVNKDTEATISYVDAKTNKVVNTEPIQGHAGESWNDLDNGADRTYETMVPQGYKYSGKEFYKNEYKDPTTGKEDYVNDPIESNTPLEPGQTYTIFVDNEHLDPKPPKNDPKANKANYDTLHVYYVDGYNYSNPVYPGSNGQRNPHYHQLDSDILDHYASTKYKTTTFSLKYFEDNTPYNTRFSDSDAGDVVSPVDGSTYGSDNGQNVIIPVFYGKKGGSNSGDMNHHGKNTTVPVSDRSQMDIDYEVVDGNYTQRQINQNNNGFHNGSSQSDYIEDQIPIDGVESGAQLPNRDYSDEIPSGFAYVARGNWQSDVTPNATNVIYIRKISQDSHDLAPINIRFIDQNGSDVTSDAATTNSDAPDGGTYEKGYRYFSPKNMKYGEAINSGKGLSSLLNGKYQLSSDQYQPSDFYFNSDQQNVTLLVKGLPYNLNSSNNYGQLAINREVFDGKASAGHADSDDYHLTNPIMVNLYHAHVGDTITLNPNDYENGLNNVVPDSSDTVTDSTSNDANSPYTLKITSPDQFVIKDSTGKIIDTVNTGNQPGEPENNGSTNDKVTFNYDKMSAQLPIEYRDASDPSLGKTDANGNNGIIDTEYASGKAGVQSDLSQYTTNVPDGYVYDYVDGNQSTIGTYGQSNPVVVNVLRKATGNITYVNDSDGNVVSVRPINGYQNMPLNFTSDGSNGGHKGFDYLTPYNYQFDSDASDSAPNLPGYGALDTKNGDNNVNDAILRNGDNDIVYVNNMQLGRPPKAGLNGVVTKPDGSHVKTSNGSDEYATYSHVPVYYVNAQALNRGTVKTSDILNSNDTVNENNDDIYKEVVTVGNSNSDFNLSTWEGQVPAGTKFEQVDPATWTDQGQTKVTYGDLAGTNGKKGIIIEVNPTDSTAENGTIVQPSISGSNASYSNNVKPLVIRPAKAKIQYLDVDHGDKLVGYRYHYGMTGDRMNFSNDEKLQPNGYSLAGLGQHDNILNDGDVDTIYVHDNNDTSNFGTIVVNYVNANNGSYLHLNNSDNVSDDTNGGTDKGSDISAAATNQIGSDFSISQYENNLPQSLDNYEATGIYSKYDPSTNSYTTSPTYFENGVQHVLVGVKPKPTANPYGNIKIIYRSTQDNHVVGSGTYSGLDTQTFNLASFEYSAPIGWKYSSVAGNNYPDTYPGNGNTDNVTIYVTPDGSIQDNNDTNNND